MQEKAYEARLNSLRQVLQNSRGDIAFSIDEGRYPRSSGGEVAYALIRPSSSTRLTILFHGTGNDLLFTWQELIKELLAKGRSVLIFDLDGHGSGSSTILKRADFWQMTKDLKNFLHEKDLQDYPYELVGYSLGALAILEAVYSETLQPERSVLIALPLRITLTTRFVLNELRCLLAKDFYRQALRFGWREAVPAFGKFRRSSFPLRLEEHYRDFYPALVDDLLKDKPPLSMKNKLGHNCLFIFGTHDVLASNNAGWKETASEILVIDRANHFLLPFHRRTIEAISAWIG
ncbi:MAG: alpha/beta fold hydrolase [Proteobacteria bacterium]|nr:MAG: alpha/beta fold hydrolase [Pseudomonadota bacterium]